VKQPWRGLFGMAVTLGVAFTVTANFDMEKYTGLFTLLVISWVPIEVVMGLGWRGDYPDTKGLSQPWKGMLLTGFMCLFGTLVCFGLLNFMGAGVVHPFIIVYAIVTVIVTFFAIIAFGMWPFHKMSLPAKGFLSLICAYILAGLILRLFNFSMLSYPAGVRPSPVAAVAFYAPGGPFAALAGISPKGPFCWESALSFLIWMVLFLFVFAYLEMWPINKVRSLMQQPVLGILLSIITGVCAYIAHIVGIIVLQIEPLNFLVNGICYIFGLLMFMLMFQMWPGRGLKPPYAGFIKLILAIGIGILSFYGIGAFCKWHFGKAFVYPNNWFSMANVMLGLIFPAWAAYGGFWDFWPLSPTQGTSNP